ncbi:hypothetical protein E2320_019873 [Naja naja]|nr:hypothetical protein E2320_019873 [Naja naja]
MLENYITCMETKFPALHILIRGHFNARLRVQVPPSIEALYSQEILQAIGHQISARHSKDELTNFAGIQLALLASQHNKIILNGSTLGDLAGEFTFSSSRGSSVIDFVLVSQLLRKAVRAFYVDCLMESDHYPLVTIIGLSSNIHLSRGPQILDPYVVSYTRRIKWSSNTERKFHSFLSSPECLSLYNQALTNSGPETISALESLINSVQRELGANGRPSGPYHSRSNPWLDKECLMLRNQINRVYLLYRNRGDKCPPEDYYLLKREYKGLIAKKKRAKEREKWDLLLFSIQQKNTRLFWQIVASSLPGHQELPLCCISNRDWENHFLSIFQASTSLTELGPQLPPAIPDWQPMTHVEINELISELKSGKAPGPDAIPPDLLKSNPEWWIPLLATLFTHINISGKIPTSWRLIYNNIFLASTSNSYILFLAPVSVFFKKKACWKRSQEELSIYPSLKKEENAPGLRDQEMSLMAAAAGIQSPSSIGP